MPVSNISQSVKRLENELGVQLFDHKGNRVVLNNDGRQFYSYASRALSLLDTAVGSLSDSETDLRGDIRLVCLSNYKLVMIAIERFLKEHPNVNFIIRQSYEDDGDYDILVSDIFPSEHKEKVLLADEEIAIAMNKEHSLAKCDTVSVKDLENERFIALSSSDSMRKIIIETCEKAGFSPNFAIQTVSANYQRRCIELGLGITFASIKWKEKYFENIEYKKIEGLRRKTYAFLPKKKHTRRSVSTFLKILSEEAKAIFEE